MKKSTLFAILLLSALASFEQDLSIAAPFGSIVSPVSGCSLSSTENVTVRLFNFGSSIVAGSSFNVSYSINGGAPVTEMVTLGTTLLSNSALTYTFVTNANLSAPGTYSIDATVSFPGDVNAANNTYTGHVVSSSASSFGGIISGSTTACAASNSGTLTLTGNTGSIVRWEYSADNGNTWLYISNTTATQAYSNLAQTTMYRAVIQNGSCGFVFSSVATITINC